MEPFYCRLLHLHFRASSWNAAALFCRTTKLHTCRFGWTVPLTHERFVRISVIKRVWMWLTEDVGRVLCGDLYLWLGEILWRHTSALLRSWEREREREKSEKQSDEREVSGFSSGQKQYGNVSKPTKQTRNRDKGQTDRQTDGGETNKQRDSEKKGRMETRDERREGWWRERTSESGRESELEVETDGGQEGREKTRSEPRDGGAENTQDD